MADMPAELVRTEPKKAAIGAGTTFRINSSADEARLGAMRLDLVWYGAADVAVWGKMRRGVIWRGVERQARLG